MVKSNQSWTINNQGSAVAMLEFVTMRAAKINERQFATNHEKWRWIQDFLKYYFNYVCTYCVFTIRTFTIFASLNLYCHILLLDIVNQKYFAINENKWFKKDQFGKEISWSRSFAMFEEDLNSLLLIEWVLK